jgi:hypothetical protein
LEFDMKDHTIPGIIRNSTITKPHGTPESRFICNMEQCQRDASNRVGIALCERHIEKAWAAYQVLMGANVPDKLPDPERDRKSLDAPGVVYVIRVQDMIKIGWTSDPKRRMQDLQPDAILHYQAGSRRDEYKLQGRCMDYLVKGREWFDTSPAMIQFVKDLRLGKIAA